MRNEGPSRTAIGVAVHRAAHQLVDIPPVFVDPFALRIVGPKARTVLERNPRRVARQPFASYLRAVLAVRSRVAEEALAAAVGRGVRQYVVLGAGLDTFALRNCDASLRVFEVDHPNTQRWKRRRLQEEHLGEPPNLTFVPVDFEHQDLETELRKAGLSRDRSTFFSWLGVVPYLRIDAIWATLRAVAASVGRDGGVAFDFMSRPPRRHLLGRLILWSRARRVARLGEPFQSFLEPADLSRQLRSIGFVDIAVLGPADLNDRYLSHRADRLRVGRVTHMAVAVGAGGPDEAGPGRNVRSG